MVLDVLFGWFLTLVSEGLDLIPDWTLTWPSTSGFLTPLSQINWLIGIDMLFAVVGSILILGPGFLAARLALWVIGLFTPGGTKN